MEKNIVITNPEKLKEAKKSISEAGAERLQVRTDFDRTLTTAFVDGKSIPSLISILRDGDYLTPDYAQKAHDLYNKYHPIEMSSEIPHKEKKRAMQEWWETHFDLLIKSGLNKKDLKNVVESRKARFRDGADQFFGFLRERNIPLLIISSSGLGGDNISMYLQREKKLYDNVYVISNSFEWDENGNAIGVKRPIVHVMNKDETVVRDLPVFDSVKDRKNVLLMGDSLDDIGMIKGFDYDNLIKIGFLNEKVEENLEYYKSNFDALILNDSSMDYVNRLLKEMIG